MKIDGGTLAVAQLRRDGIDRLFALNGGHVGPIFDACLELGLPIVDVRHEDAAVHMAHAYARAGRRIAAACVTAGPGVTNTVTAVATAHANAAPVILIGGKAPVPQFDMGALQDLEQTAIMRPITSLSRTVLRPHRIPGYLSEAARAALRPPQGPAFVEIPTDVLRGHVDGESHDDVTLPPAGEPLPAASPEDVSSVARLLEAAERPVLLAGSGVWWAGAGDVLRQLVEATGIPLLTTSLARGVLEDGHRLNLYAARSLLLSQADVVVVLGTRFNFVLNYGLPPRLPVEATVVHVDAAPGELNRNRRADLAVLADLAVFLPDLAEALGDPPDIDAAWLDAAVRHHERSVRALDADARSDSVPVHPLRLCADVMDAAPPGTRFVADGGDILSYARLALHPDAPGRYMDPGPFGTLGVGVPFANAYGLLSEGAPVICVTGDGALGINVMELDTSVRHGIPIVVVVSNNAAWGIERNSQIVDFGEDRVIATELRDARYDRIAEALGCHAERVTDPAAVGDAVRRAIESGGPALVDVVTEPDVRSPDLRRGLARVPDATPLDRWGSREATTEVP